MCVAAVGLSGIRASKAGEQSEPKKDCIGGTTNEGMN